MAAMSLSAVTRAFQPRSSTPTTPRSACTPATEASAQRISWPGGVTTTAASSPIDGSLALRRPISEDSRTMIPSGNVDVKTTQGFRKRDSRGQMQGVVKAYDPGTGEGTVVRDTDRSEYSIAPGALVGSVFRMLRQGQRVIWDLDVEGQA